MNKDTLEQLIFDLDQRISEMVKQRDHLRALVTLTDQLDATTAERIVSGILGAVKTKAAEIDAVSDAALSVNKGPETQ